VRNSNFATLNSFDGSARTILATIAVIEAEREFLSRYKHQLSVIFESANFATSSNHRSSAMWMDSSKGGAT
jgi:hypothetical protein